jgi:hypothetical protein
MRRTASAKYTSLRCWSFGLPYSVTKTEIIDFFGEEFDLKESDINICCWYDGKATGEAFAKFSFAELAKKAMCSDRMTIGSRYVELFPSTAEERSCASTWCWTWVLWSPSTVIYINSISKFWVGILAVFSFISF